MDELRWLEAPRRLDGGHLVVGVRLGGRELVGAGKSTWDSGRLEEAWWLVGTRESTTGSGRLEELWRLADACVSTTDSGRLEGTELLAGAGKFMRGFEVGGGLRAFAGTLMPGTTILLDAVTLDFDVELPTDDGTGTLLSAALSLFLLLLLSEASGLFVFLLLAEALGCFVLLDLGAISLLFYTWCAIS